MQRACVERSDYAEDRKDENRGKAQVDTPMDEVQIEIIGSKLLERVVQTRFNVFGGVKAIPELAIRLISRVADTSYTHTFEVSQMSSLGTPLSLIALPTSSSFYIKTKVSAAKMMFLER